MASRGDEEAAVREPNNLISYFDRGGLCPDMIGTLLSNTVDPNGMETSIDVALIELHLR